MKINDRCFRWIENNYLVRNLPVKKRNIEFEYGFRQQMILISIHAAPYVRNDCKLPTWNSEEPKSISSASIPIYIHK